MNVGCRRWVDPLQKYNKPQERIYCMQFPLWRAHFSYFSWPMDVTPTHIRSQLLCNVHFLHLLNTRWWFLLLVQRSWRIFMIFVANFCSWYLKKKMNKIRNDWAIAANRRWNYLPYRRDSCNQSCPSPSSMSKWNFVRDSWRSSHV